MWFLTQEAGFASVQRGRYLPILPCLPAQTCWLPFHLAICHLWPGWAKLLLNTNTNNKSPSTFVCYPAHVVSISLSWFVTLKAHYQHGKTHILSRPDKSSYLHTEVMQPFCKKLRRLHFINANCTIKDKNLFFFFFLNSLIGIYTQDGMHPVFGWIRHIQELLTWQ